jgi:Holliday junction resolvasome RuvABC DNA-binding subunit
VAFFQTIPGIGPKTAKKILVELKSSFSSKDLIKINADDKLVKNITKTLTAMGYDKTKVLTKLAQYEDEINDETLATVLQWMIKGL